MKKPTPLQLALVLLVLVKPSSAAFGSFGKASSTKLPTPTFDKATGRYVPNPLDDGEYPYDAIGSALRHGPSPFLTRVFNADEYEQGVLKYMLTQKVSRAEATGNVDAKLNNAMDWAYQKMEEEKGAPKVDYTALDPKRAALTTVWALAITPLVVNVVASTFGQLAGEPGPCVSKAFEGLGICSEYIPR